MQSIQGLRSPFTGSMTSVNKNAVMRRTIWTLLFALRKHAYSNILKISPPKTESFQIKIDKNSDIFLISAQNIDCGYSLEPPRRGGSNEYPQSMFLSRNKKNNAYPCKPQFYYIKVGFKGSKLYRYVFVMAYGIIVICVCEQRRPYPICVNT